MIRLLLISDAVTVRGGLGKLLNRERGIVVAGEVDIEDPLAQRLARVRPQVALFNTDYMVSQILPVVAELRSAVTGCGVIVLSDPTKRGMLPPRRHARELSFLVKGTQVATLAEAIRRVARGERVVDPRLAIASIGTARVVSTTELEILGLAAQGDSVADISRRLYLSLGTVRNYISAAILKTGARNRLDAIRIVRKDGWLK